MDNIKAVIEKFRIAPGTNVDLQKFKPHATPGISQAEAELEMPPLIARLDKLQQKLYAEGKQSLLVVIQAMDTGGKDGLIRRVFGLLNAQGVRVASFKVPSKEELSHDYLWRYHKEVPSFGMIGVFNRSHYESVLVERVHNLAPKEALKRRYDEINAFEKYLSDSNVRVLKFFLHISKDEQKRRLEERLKNPAKNWKFSEADIAERKFWLDYQKAFEKLLSQCSTKTAPWYVIPSNNKWYRSWLAGVITERVLLEMNCKFPKAAPGIEKIKVPD